MKEKKTYWDIGKENGLSGDRLKMFTKYMRIRWGASEAEHVQHGYAKEWAIRFKEHKEYVMSDLFGQKLIDALDREADKNV